MLHEVALGIIIGLIFISLVVLFCLLLGKLYIQKIKNYTQVIYQKDIDFQKVLNTAIIETQEQTLHNISQDLHDDAGQQLTYINFQLENLKLDSPELQRALEPLSESVNSLSKSIRSISHSLNSQLLSKQDILKSIALEAKRLQKNNRIAINCTIDDKVRKVFSINEKIVIYRIFQEAINNVLKHSGASQVSIEIATFPHFVMSIHDNGKGFDYESIKENHSTLGLENMKIRAGIINYAVEISSNYGEGTAITVSETPIS